MGLQQYNQAMPSVPSSPVWIDQPASLEHLAQDLNSHSRVAVDTESNSLHAFKEQVCLIQFSTTKKDYLLDPLDLTDLSSLASFFANPRIEKVFHAVEYDLIGLKRDFSFEVTNIFDTMQSARILGYTQVGLDALLALKFRLKVDKRYQKADWAYRPLPKEMMNYAHLDTHYLIPLRNLLARELKDANLWELAQEEFIRLAKFNGNGRMELPSWQRVSGTQRFDQRQLTILKALCEWRDKTASRLARPTFKVMNDKRLVAIVLAGKENLTQLESLLTENQRRRYASEVREAIKRGAAGPLISRPRKVHPNRGTINRMKALSQLRKDISRQFSIESDIILPKCWMQDIAEKNPSTLEDLTPLMPESPWRLSKFGKLILKAIH